MLNSTVLPSVLEFCVKAYRFPVKNRCFMCSVFRGVNQTLELDVDIS